MSGAIYNEIEPFACNWLERLIAAGHIGPGAVERRSVADLTAADVSGHGQRHFFAGIGGWSAALRSAGVPDDADVWTGSCPCQPFSAAGKRGGVGDARHLWPAWFRLIAECRPPIVVGEQVASRDGLAWLDLVRADMEGAGYAFGAADLCAASVGAVHIRQRIYFLAYAASIGGEAHDRVVAGGTRRAQVAARGLPGVHLAGGGWSSDAWASAEPILVPNDHGLPGVLAGIGNAIVPQVAAAFIRAALDAIGVPEVSRNRDDPTIAGRVVVGGATQI